MVVVVRNYNEFDLGKSVGVAIRAFPLTNGIADCLLSVNRKAVGVIEVKPEVATLIFDAYSSFLRPIPKAP